jgi:hypothetical protein
MGSLERAHAQLVCPLGQMVSNNATGSLSTAVGTGRLCRPMLGDGGEHEPCHSPPSAGPRR